MAYVADRVANSIRRIAAGVISPFAGNGTLSLTPDGRAATDATVSTGPMAVDNSGNLFYQDNSDVVIRKITASAGLLSTIAGNGALDYNGDGVFNSADKFYAFGGPDASYVPIVGDWNGSGTTKIGFYRAGFWVLDVNGNGIFDAGDAFDALGGNGAGEVPLVGDWNGDKRTKIGFYYNGQFVLDYDGNGVFTTADRYYNNFSFLPGDKPIVGDWSGTGTTKIGVYRNGFWILDYNGNGTYDGTGTGGDKFYSFGGQSGNIPIVADWNGDGRAKVGNYNSGFWTLDFNGNGMYDAGDRFIALGGTPGNQPIIGRW